MIGWLETHSITAHQKEHYYKLKKTRNADQPHSTNKKPNNKSALNICVICVFVGVARVCGVSGLISPFHKISLVFWATELDTRLSSSICQPASINKSDQFSFLGNRARYEFIELDMSTGLDLSIPSSVAQKTKLIPNIFRAAKVRESARCSSDCSGIGLSSQSNTTCFGLQGSTRTI